MAIKFQVLRLVAFRCSNTQKILHEKNYVGHGNDKWDDPMIKEFIAEVSFQFSKSSRNEEIYKNIG